MRAIVSLLRWNRGEAAYQAGLDLGGGQVLAPEDVLDGHCVRLLANRSHKATQTVPVRVNDNLSAAITVMAPNLAPLTDLAEEVAVAVPAVAPEPAFRQNLYQALERTHRQYRVQEALGTRLLTDDGGRRFAVMWMTGGLVICVAAIVGWLAVRKGRSGAGR